MVENVKTLSTRYQQPLVKVCKFAKHILMSLLIPLVSVAGFRHMRTTTNHLSLLPGSVGI